MCMSWCYSGHERLHATAACNSCIAIGSTAASMRACGVIGRARSRLLYRHVGDTSPSPFCLLIEMTAALCMHTEREREREREREKGVGNNHSGLCWQIVECSSLLCVRHGN